MPNTVAIIQARMGSQRLAGKVLLDLQGQPVLARCVSRLERSSLISEIVIATTDELSDNAIVDLSERQAWPVFRGSEHDVLDRFYQAAISRDADYVVRITADCPLIDSELVDQVIFEALEDASIDYACTAKFPRGLDTEVIRADALERAWRSDQNKAWREHVTPFFYHHPEQFNIHYHVCGEDLSAMRWTLDTAADYEFIRSVFAQFDDHLFTWRDVLELIRERDDIARLNQHIEQKDASLRCVESSAIARWQAMTG